MSESNDIAKLYATLSTQNQEIVNREIARLLAEQSAGQ